MKPILFNTEMVRAILAGRKTETRRLANRTNAFGLITRPYEEGDVLYVRETWDFLPCITCMERDCSLKPAVYEDAEAITEGCWIYRADGENPVFMCGHNWRPSIHMPKQAARIFLKVTKVSCQNLQDITDVDARAEGLGDPDVIYTNGALSCMFADIWDSTMPKSRLARDGWAANPSVWVFRFKRIEKPAVALRNFETFKM